MKKIIIAALLASFIMSCASNKTINGTCYETYGFINQSENKSEKVKYKICVGNFMWGIILVETVVFPIYFFGFSLYEPIAENK